VRAAEVADYPEGFAVVSATAKHNVACFILKQFETFL
jgi:hypothetical protein